jgi:hypothetical protein
MSDDWLEELHQLREQDRVTRQAAQEQLDLSVLSSERDDKQAADLLRQADAHNLLRRVQKALLGGKGVIDFLDQKSHYDRVMTLMWQGPISAARNPDPEDPEAYQYILVGVRQGKLYVNGKEVSPITPEALKVALVNVAKKPGRARPGKKSK